MRRGFRRDVLMVLALLSDAVDVLSFSAERTRRYWPDYQPRYLSEVVSRMARVGEIEKEIVSGEPVLKLTAGGWRILDEVVPLRKLAKKDWDGVWRLVIFDIWEKQRYLRDALRKKLLQLGFGRWQRSVYISPHDVLREMNEFLAAKKLFPRGVCLEAGRVGFGNDKALAAHVFRLEELNEEYRDIADDCEELCRGVKEGEAPAAKAEAKLGKIWFAYRDLLLRDPYLPPQLLPDDWAADDACEEFARLNKTLGFVFRV